MINAVLYYPIMFLLCHLVPDYLLQSDWMTLNKSKLSLNCLVHVLIYTCCFLFLTHSIPALLFIGGTHFLLDRFHIIMRKLLWWKNHFPTMKYPPFEYCNSTGYFDDSPYNIKKADEAMIAKFGKPRHFFITIWIYIVCDNVLHLLCNLIALTLLSN